MAGTSVTGTGHGAAFPGQKGPGNGRNVFLPLVSPHVVSAGKVTLAGGTATITFPTPLTGSGATKYVVSLTAMSATTTLPRVTTVTDNSDSNFASFVITGNGTDVISWVVISTGTGV